MALLTIPQRYLSQPQHHVEIAPEYADAQLLALFNTAEWRDLSKKHSFSSGSAPSYTVGGRGRTLSFNGSNLLEVSPSVSIAPKFTVFAWVRPYVLNSGYIRIVETSYSSSFYLGSNTGSQYAFIVNNSSLEGCVGGQQAAYQWDFVGGVFDGVNRILYVNGREVGRNTATTPSSAPLPMRIAHSNSGGTFAWNGELDTVGLFPRAFSADQMLSLYHDPYQLVRPVQRRIYFTPSAPSTDHDLTASNAVQTNSATPSVITQIHSLAVQSPAQGNIAANTAIAITQTLAGANATQSNIAQAGAISQGAGFLADSLDQGNVLVAGAIAQSHALTGGTGAQGNAASAGAITQTHSLTISNAVQANPASAGGIALDGDINLTVQASVQSNSFFTDPIHQTHILVISATAQGNSTEAVTVTQVHPLTAAQLAQVNSVSTGPAFVEGQLAVDEPLQANSLSAGAITTIQTLVIGGFAQDNRMSSGAVSPGAIFEAAAAAGTELRERIKKPGIPSDAPRWLRTTIEIVLGRRNNKIEIPQHQEITFSATPTQEECKALYDYTSSVRNSLEQLINRFDS